MIVKRNLLCFFLLTMMLAVSCVDKHQYSLFSPDKNLQITLNTKDGNLQLSQKFDNKIILNESPIGLLVDSINLTNNIRITDIQDSSFDENWNTVNGKNKTVRNHYNEYILNCQSNELITLKFKIVFRCYNNGFAYRYHFPIQDSFDSLNISNELTKLNFATDFTYWAYNGENHNLGPLKGSDTSMISIQTPIVMQTKDDLFLAIHEAEIIRYTPFSLISPGNDHSLEINIAETKDILPAKTSWRAFMFGHKAGDLLESDLLVNLNEACKIEDPSWIKPGKAMWDWRVWGYKAEDGFEYGLNTVSHKRFIDFAADNNVQYLLIDADWYGEEFNENSNPTTSREGVNIGECMEYAKEKGVGVILYLNDVGAKKFGLEKVIKQFFKWGAIGVKYGFMRGSWEQKVRHTREVVKLCAKYKLMVNFHDNPVPPSGDRRTWPNLVTKEFCHSQADAKRSYYPETAVTSPFVNMIAGPIDYCDGWFDLNNNLYREKVFEEIPGTVAAEVAKLIIAYSGWKILPDSPEEYLKKKDLFECIKAMPAQFDSFKVLDGKIGEYITIARQAGDDWFVGSLTNREERTIEVDFSFLPEGKSYIATLYEDASETHYLDNKESYRKGIIKVVSGNNIKVRLAPGGGHAIHLKYADNSLSDEALQLEKQILKCRISDENKLIHDDYFSWGGSVIKGDDGKYHMFYARWPHGSSGRIDTITDKPFIGFKGWLKYSEIAYAVADKAEGPFNFVKTIIQGSRDSATWNCYNAHNPHIKRFNGKFYLYYIANNPLHNNEPNQNVWMKYCGSQRIGLAIANSIEDLVNGKYEICQEPLIVPDNENTYHRVVNPSVTQGPDSKYLMMYKSSSQSNGYGHMTHWIAKSDNPEGPFKLVGPVFTKAEYAAEDPYFWYDKKRNKFFAIVKDFSHSRKLTPQFGALALITSDDGITNWRPAAYPMVSLKQYINEKGNIIRLAHLERPQLLLDDNGQPMVLYAAASEKSPFNVTDPIRMGKPEHNTFNIQIKLLDN